VPRGYRLRRKTYNNKHVIHRKVLSHPEDTIFPRPIRPHVTLRTCPFPAKAIPNDAFTRQILIVASRQASHHADRRNVCWRDKVQLYATTTVKRVCQMPCRFEFVEYLTRERNAPLPGVGFYSSHNTEQRLPRLYKQRSSTPSNCIAESTSFERARIWKLSFVTASGLTSNMLLSFRRELGYS